MLKQYDYIPAGLLSCEARDLHDLLGGPTLIHLEGARREILFVSVLMHGNETSGWYAVRELLHTLYQNPVSARPRSLSLFIANTEATKHGVRHMPNTPDYNRVWPGSELPPSPEHELMQQVFDEMRSRELFVSVDIHNNTGLNPHYACVHKLDAKTLKLATLFGRTIVYFIRPVGVQSIAMSEACPAVTLECGKAEHHYGYEHALAYLAACAHLSELPDTPVPPHDIDLFHTTATVKIPNRLTFGYATPERDLSFVPDLEKFNFQELEVGELFAKTQGEIEEVLDVKNETGESVFDEYFEVISGELRTRKVVMPSMLTSNLEVIRQDCLCYLMERYDYSAQA